MAEAVMDYHQAVDKILGWYHSLRVDHLMPYELDFELNIRSIVIRDDPTYSRRRRSLRDQLKVEKENNQLISVELDVDGEETIQFCRQNFNEISEGLKENDKILRVRGQSRLLHFGHRIVLLVNNARELGEAENFLKAMLIDVVNILLQYFYKDSGDQRGNIREELEDPHLVNLFTTEIDSTAPVLSSTEAIHKGTTPVSSASTHSGDTVCMGSLMARIRELEAELDRRDKQRDERSRIGESGVPGDTQQPISTVRPEIPSVPFNDPPFTHYPAQLQVSQNSSKAGNVQPCQPARSTGHYLYSGTSTTNSQVYPTVYTRPCTSVTFSLPQSHSSALPHSSSSWYAHLQKTSNPALSMTSTSVPWPQTSVVNNTPNVNPWLNNPALSSAPVPPSWSQNPIQSTLGTTAPTTYPYSNPFNTPHGTLVAGYQGRRSLPVSKWSISKYDGEDQGLKLNQFLGMVHAMAVSEHVSEAELYDSAIHLFKGPALQWYMTLRTTGRLLNWQHLVLELRRTFMHPDLDTMIKMKIYQRHQFRNETFLQYYHSMEELFGTMSIPLPEYEKVQILMQNVRIDYKKQLNFLPIADLQTLVSAGQKIDAVNFSVYSKVFGPEKSVNTVECTETSAKPKKEKQLNKLISSKQSSPPSNPSQQNQQRGSQTAAPGPRGSTRSNPTLEDLIELHQPLSQRHCFNCGKFGHRMGQCRLPKGVLCENCGFRGYPSDNCPYCVKNAMAASENRRPLNHHF